MVDEKTETAYWRLVLASDRLPERVDRTPTPQEIQRKAVEAFNLIPAGALDTDGDAGELAFDGVLSRHGISVVRKYAFGAMQFVIKRSHYCDVHALESLAGRDIRAYQYGHWSWIVCPLAVRVAGDFVFELQPFVEGMLFDQLVARNRYPFAGQFVGKLYVTLIKR
jgi:hypothetical protein